MRHRNSSLLVRHDDRTNAARIFAAGFRQRFNDRAVIGAGVREHILHRAERFHLLQKRFGAGGDGDGFRESLSHSRLLNFQQRTAANSLKNRRNFQPNCGYRESSYDSQLQLERLPADIHLDFLCSESRCGLLSLSKLVIFSLLLYMQGDIYFGRGGQNG